MSRKKIRRTLGVLAVGGAIGLAAYLLIEHFHIRRFREVEVGRLYRSGQPEGEDWARLVSRYHIRTVVNLRPLHDRQEGAWFVEEQQAAAKYKLRWVEEPMPKHVPTAEQADAFLALVNDRENWPVLVHCNRGKDRAGIMSALYRMHVQGWSADRAFAELCDIKGETPDTDVLGFLRSYRPGPSAATKLTGTSPSAPGQ